MVKIIKHLCYLLIILSNSSYGQSLFKPDQYKSIVSDRKAYKIGDTLTVLIIENSSATTAAGTNAGKTTGINVGFNVNSRSEKAGLELGEDFDGKGKIQRSGKLLAQITVTVKSIEPETGLLFVSGEQAIQLNDEKQEIKLEGKVRTIDIGDNNIIQSTRLADAKITYMGDGILADHQRPGIITRFLVWLGLL